MGDTLAGWRAWFVLTQDIADELDGGDAIKLISPFGNKGGGYDGTDSWPAWRRRVHAAECTLSPDHTPPAEGCTCGVYASPNVVDVLCISRCLHRLAVSAGGPARSVPWVMVVGAVTMLTAHPINTNDVAEIRAAAGRIERLYICDYPPGVECESGVVAELLRRRYEVPVTMGEPQFSQADWDARSVVAQRDAEGYSYDYDYAGLARPGPARAAVD
ncbi:hypothetical protein ABQE58_25110 [Mycolicibacterium elephantis]